MIKYLSIILLFCNIAFCQGPGYIANLNVVFPAAGEPEGTYPLLLDEGIANVWGMWGPARRGSTNWSGPIITVLRTSDNLFTNITYDANNVLDISALANFCRQANGVVMTNWDMTGNGHHKTQSTIANMPQIWSGTTKVLPLGDSITWGYAEHDNIGGYRGHLYTLMTNHGLTIDMQGPGNHGPASLPDKDHAGFEGDRIAEVSTDIDPFINPYQSTVVILMAGINDMLNLDDVENAPSRLQTLAQKFIDRVPNVQIIICTITPLVQTKTNFNDEVIAFNAELPDVVSNLGSQAVLCDVYAAFDPGDISADDIHPTAAGYTNIANTIAGTLTNLTLAGSIITDSNGFPALSFNGTSHTIATAQDTGLTQPTYVMANMQQESWTLSRRVYDGYTTVSMTMFQHDSSSELALYAGGTALIGSNAPIAIPFLSSVLFDGASSSIQINTNTTTTGGNPGTTAPQGFRVGSDSGPSLFANVKWTEGIVIDGSPSAAEINTMQTNINGYFGIWEVEEPPTPPIAGPIDLVSANVWDTWGWPIRMSTNYSGAAGRIREASGNTETDISFVARGDGYWQLDTNAINTHCGAADGFLVTWYAEFSTNNFLQATAAQQPKIYDGTAGDVLRAPNGLPAIDFDGVNHNMETLTNTLAQPVTVYFVTMAETHTINEFFFDGMPASSMGVAQRNNDSTNAVVGSAGLFNFADYPPLGTYFLMTVVFNGSSSVAQNNNGPEATGDAGSAIPNGMHLMERGNNALRVDGRVQSMTVYSAAHAIGNRGTIQTNLNNSHVIY